MCEAVGHPVEELERVAFGPLRLGALGAGRGAPADGRRGRAAEESGRIGRMKLRALRGAITVDANDGDAILDATEELMRALIDQNALEADGPRLVHLHVHATTWTRSSRRSRRGAWA